MLGLFPQIWCCNAQFRLWKGESPAESVFIPTFLVQRTCFELSVHLFSNSDPNRHHLDIVGQTSIPCVMAAYFMNRTTTNSPTATCTGTTYTVASADTCQSIASAKSIAIDRLISDNRLDYNCTSLEAGTTLCLGPSCALQTVTRNQTCQDITQGKQFTNVQLISWNPYERNMPPG